MGVDTNARLMAARMTQETAHDYASLMEVVVGVVRMAVRTQLWTRLAIGAVYMEEVRGVNTKAAPKDLKVALVSVVLMEVESGV